MIFAAKQKLYACSLKKLVQHIPYVAVWHCFFTIFSQYQEERFTREQWFGTVKKEYEDKKISPFGQVPIVSVDLDSGSVMHMAQTNSIFRYFAKLNNLYGETPLEQYQCDLVLDGVEDWRSYVHILTPQFYYYQIVVMLLLFTTQIMTLSLTTT